MRAKSDFLFNIYIYIYIYTYIYIYVYIYIYIYINQSTLEPRPYIYELIKPQPCLFFSVLAFSV